MTRALALTFAMAIALAAAGCGGDSSGETTAPTVSIPAITAPASPTTTAPATTTAPTGSSTTKGGKPFNPNAPDSATNDVPPPAGSPQSAFEKQCEKNPQACG